LVSQSAVRMYLFLALGYVTDVTAIAEQLS
jgi:hypothetical protein